MQPVELASQAGCIPHLLSINFCIIFVCVTLDGDALFDRDGDAEEGRVAFHLLGALGARPDEAVDLLSLFQRFLESFVHHAVQQRLHLPRAHHKRAHHFLAAHLRKNRKMSHTSAWESTWETFLIFSDMFVLMVLKIFFYREPFSWLICPNKFCRCIESDLGGKPLIIDTKHGWSPII